MNIGATIKKLRRERDITQEQLAEFLNISVSAVSQWESNKTSPDISALPLLSNIFEVSADTLLGIDVDSKEKKIEEIFKSACDASWSGYHKETVEILRQGLAQFPTSYKLMDMLAGELYCYINTETEEEKSAQLQEVASLCQKILDGCTDNDIRNEIAILVCHIYRETGKRDEAVKLAKSMPNYQSTSNELLTSLYTGSELINLNKDNIYSLAVRLHQNMHDLIFSRENDDGTPFFTDDEKLQMCDKGIKIFEIIYENGDYFFNSQFVKMFHIKMARIYSTRSDIENSITHIESAAKYCIMFDTYDQTAKHTSLLSRGIESGGFIKDDEYFSHSSGFLETLAESQFDFIRANPRFIAVEEELKKI